MSDADGLRELRRKIDEIDEEILRLLNKRGSVAIEVSGLKKQNSSSIYHPDREREVEERVVAGNEGPLPSASVLAVFREIISACRALQEPIVVAYLGPEGSYAHQAAYREFGSAADLMPTPSIQEVFKEVEKGKAACGIVPIENSTEGSVNVALDMFLDSELTVIAEVFLRVNHCLMSHTGKLEEVRVIASHPQALGQCRSWLARNASALEIRETASTAQAALNASHEHEIAAISGELAASIYNLRLIEKHIEDTVHNTTRFWVISKSACEPTSNDKTSIMFSLKDEPGALNNALGVFADAGVNLTKIESRPSKERPWDYVFFVDFIGHVEDAGICEILEKMKRSCLFLKTLGSYQIGKMG